MKPSGIFGGHLNIRSLILKCDEIRTLLTGSNLDFLCLSETWLHENILTSMVDCREAADPLQWLLETVKLYIVKHHFLRLFSQLNV